MPTKQTSAKKAEKKEYFELPLQRIINAIKKGNSLTLVLTFLLMILSFALGSLYTKVSYLEGGFSQTAAAPTTVQDTFVAYAKQLKMDTKKFQACITEKKYDNRITADLSEVAKLSIQQATPTFFVNGKFLGGAFPYEAFKDIIDKELAGTGSENYLDYNEMLQQAYAPDNPQQRAFEPVNKAIAIGDAPVRGDNNAKVTIVEFSDFQCPYCQRAFTTVEKILTDYKGKVRLVYKHLPITDLHPNARVAAEASECAREQNKFWEYHDVLFNNQQQWSALPQTPPTTS